MRIWREGWGEVTRIPGLPFTSPVILNELDGISEAHFFHHKMRILTPTPTPTTIDPAAQRCCEDKVG